MKLDIGCGASKREGFVGIDILPIAGVDIVHNLEEFPYPIESDSVDEIWMDQVLEHLNNPMKVVEELYRISKNGAKITIGVPYYRSFYAAIDPTHVNFFSTHWFNYFDPSNELCKRYRYSNARFKVESIEFDREWNKKSLLQKAVIAIANKKILLYESKLSSLYPLNSLTFYLTVLKN